MRTFITSLPRLPLLPRRRRAIAVPLLVAGALAAGCGTQHATTVGPAGQTAAAGQAGSSAGPSAHAPAPRHPTPVPTVTGGTVAVGQPACVGWPAHALRVTMPAVFVPVAAERCVTSIATVAGKGRWETATLEKATSDLAPLAAALRHPPAVRSPGMICPDLAMLPPQIVVINASGQELIPLLPVSGCGLVQSAVLAAINALPWQPVSVRLIAPVAHEKGSTAATRAVTDSPKAIQNLSNEPGVLPQ